MLARSKISARIFLELLSVLLLSSIVSCAVAIKHVPDAYLIVTKPLSGDKGERNGIDAFILGW